MKINFEGGEGIAGIGFVVCFVLGALAGVYMMYPGTEDRRLEQTRHSRQAQRCERAGQAHNCLRYSARATGDDCFCIGPTRTRVGYGLSREEPE